MGMVPASSPSFRSRAALARRGRGAAAAVLLSAALLATPGSAAASKRPTVTPSCDLMPGATEALSAQWRVFYPTREVKGQTMVACRRLPGPARELTTVGPEMGLASGVQLTGGIALLRYADQNGKYVPARRGYQLVDLDGARLATSPTFPFSAEPGASGGAVVHLLEGGALAIWDDLYTSATPPPTRVTALSDGLGSNRLLFEGAPRLDAPVPSTAAFAAPGAGIYLTDSAGDVRREASSGTAQITWAADPSVRRIPNPVRVLPRPPKTRRSLGAFDFGIRAELVRERKAGRVTSWVTINGSRVVRIRPTTKPKLIAAAQWYLAIDGRWGAGEKRSVRVYLTGSRRPRVVVERPTPAGGWKPGELGVTGYGAVAVAEPGGLRVWDPEERVIDLPGARDLVPTPTDPAVIFATGADGAGHLFRLGGRRKR